MDDFERIDAIVRATVLASGTVHTWNSPRRVTTDPMDLSKAHRVKVAEFLNQPGEIRGVTFTCENNDYEFDIWINPAVVQADNPNFRSTLLHELCHGYRGAGKGHDPAWRRLYARALFHYHYASYTIDHYISLVDLANWRYTKRGKTETSGDFLKRINHDRETWLRQADDEHEKVHDIWAKMLDPNWTRQPASPRQKRSQVTSH